MSDSVSRRDAIKRLATITAGFALSGDITRGGLTIRRTARDITIAGPAACAISRSGSGDVHCAHEAQN